MTNRSTQRNEHKYNSVEEVTYDYARYEERMTETVIFTKAYPEPYVYDDVEPLSNMKRFAGAEGFNTAALDQDGFCDR